jgi:hypothetical protein
LPTRSPAAQSVIESARFEHIAKDTLTGCEGGLLSRPADYAAAKLTEPARCAAEYR